MAYLRENNFGAHTPCQLTTGSEIGFLRPSPNSWLFVPA